MGASLKKHFRFSYLWPAVPCDGISKIEKWDDLQTLFPFGGNEFKNLQGCRKLYPHPQLMKSAHFDYCFLDSYMGTALDQHNFTAGEGTLHDAEFIAPYIRSSGLPVHLVGSLWVDKSLGKLGVWRDKLNHIRLGGEQSYGWGKVRCVCCEPIEKDEQSEDYIPDPDGFSWSGHVPAHIEVEQNEVTVQGMVEPLVGWERQTDHKQRIGRATIAFVPGFFVKNDANFAVGEYGVWEKKEDKIDS